MKVYLANGLFTLGDRVVNSTIANELRLAYFLKYDTHIDLYNPQENDEINDKNAYADSVTIARADTEKLMNSDVLIAVIDGVEIDSGTSAEIGMFATTGRPIFALYSDIRQQGREHPKKLQALINDGTENQFMYRNLFVVGLIKQTEGGIFSTITSLVQSVVDYANEIIDFEENVEGDVH